LRQSRTPKKRAKLKGRGIRWRLKKIARDYQPIITIGMYLLGDYLQDGAIDGSFLMSLLNWGIL
jgi:hypothetical protein